MTYTPKMARQGIEPLKPDQIAQIKRLLNIPQSCPLPKCPAKNQRALDRLEQNGHGVYMDPIRGPIAHRDTTHAPCAECTCQNTAGLGTTHYGWGWCHSHERGQGKMQCEQMAELDLRSHQQRNPRQFRTQQAFIDKVQKSGEKHKSDYNFTDELKRARTLVEQLFATAAEDRRNREDVKALVALVEEVRKTIKDHASFTPEEKDVLGHTLLEILERLTCSLTEKSQGGVIEMTDATRIKLQMEATKSLAEIGERVQKLESLNMISLPAWRVWMGDLFTNLKRTFGNQGYDIGAVEESGAKITRPILEGIAEAMQKTGEVRRGI